MTPTERRAAIRDGFTPPDRPDPPGTDLGDVCGRCAEPDEDAPRGFRPKPCDGEMVEDGGVVICDTCGEVV